MADERIALALRSLREPVLAPDPAFADQLFEQLATEVDFRTGVVRGKGRTERLRDATRLLVRQQLFWVATVLALLAALLLTIALIGRELQRPANLVARSEQLYRSMPPFEMTVDMRQNRGIVVRYSYNGAGLLRGDFVESNDPGRPVGSHFVFDGHVTYFFDGAGKFEHADGILGVPKGRPDSSLIRFGNVGPADADRSSALLMFPMTWDEPHQFASPEPQAHCDTIDSLGDERILGHLTQHIACDYLPGAPREMLEYWVDGETGIILRTHAGTDAFEATDVDLKPDFRRNVFDLPRGPSGALPLNVGRLEPGVFYTPRFTPTIVLRVGAGWYNGNDTATGAGVSSTGGRPYEEADDGNGNAATTPDGFDLIVERISQTFDPVAAVATPFSGSAADYIAWLRSHPTLSVGAGREVEVPGARGEMFDVTVSGSAGLVPCERFPTAQCLFLMELPGIGHLQLSAGSTSLFAVFDVRGQTVLVMGFGNLENSGRGIVEAISFPT
jgi:hypothetical protein